MRKHQQSCALRRAARGAWLPIVLFLCVALTGAAAAQTAGSSGAGLATPSGAVQLPSSALASSTAATSSGASAAVGSSGAGSAAGAGSARSGTSTTAASSGQAGSGGSAGAGAPASSGNAPAWLLCPPPGATGIAPLLAGTSLSCAP
jgi:hypothetical protein